MEADGWLRASISLVVSVLVEIDQGSSQALLCVFLRRSRLASMVPCGVMSATLVDVHQARTPVHPDGRRNSERCAKLVGRQQWSSDGFGS